MARSAAPVHQNAQLAGVEGSNVVPVGEYMASQGVVQREGSGGVEHANATVERVMHTTMRPAGTAARRVRDSGSAPLCKWGDGDECRAYAMKSADHGLCYAHSQKLPKPDPIFEELT